MARVATTVSKLKIGDLTLMGTVEKIVKTTAKFKVIRFQIGKNTDYLPEYRLSKTKKVEVFIKEIY